MAEWGGMRALKMKALKETGRKMRARKETGRKMRAPGRRAGARAAQIRRRQRRAREGAQFLGWAAALAWSAALVALVPAPVLPRLWVAGAGLAAGALLLGLVAARAARRLHRLRVLRALLRGQKAQGRETERGWKA